jgi:hypothetical protein
VINSLILFFFILLLFLFLALCERFAIETKKGGYSSIGRAAVCGTVSSQFKSGYPPIFLEIISILRLAPKKKSPSSSTG